jgi:N-acetylglucosaminyldiphosphoundecaprenol N-acetyl-beta-D-mannosaminyltransferase
MLRVGSSVRRRHVLSLRTRQAYDLLRKSAEGSFLTQLLGLTARVGERPRFLIDMERPAGKNRWNVLGTFVDAISTQEAIVRIADLASAPGRSFVSYVNAHCVNVARRDDGYRRIVNQADLAYPDGIGVVWALRWLHGVRVPRVTASDFLLEFCAEAAKRQLSMFFLGGAPGVTEEVARRIPAVTPNLRVVGTHHGYFGKDDDAVRHLINMARPNVLIVGMGVPKQEKWIAANRAHLDVGVCWAVGGALDFYSGRLRRAPGWVIRLHLEWLFRMLLEPRRMWKRYLVGNVSFILRLLFGACLIRQSR